MINYILYFHDFFSYVYCCILFKKKANMDSNTINYNEEVLKGGFIIGGISILIGMFIYVFNTKFLASAWMLLIGLLPVLIVGIYIGISYRNAIGKYISYGESLKFLFLIFIIASLLGTAFNVLLFHFIDPTLANNIELWTIENTASYMEYWGVPQEVIDQEVSKLEGTISQQYSISGILKSFPIGLIIMFLLALIASIFVKKEEPVSDRIN